MKRTLWKLSVSTTLTVGDAVSEFLGARFGQFASSYTETRTGRTTVEVYLQKKPAWSKPVRQALEQELKETTKLRRGLDLANLKLTRLRNEDWAESWKRHFKPLEIGSKLLIKPSWSQHRVKPGQLTVTLDPGMSFGTGQHPTTAFCLSELAHARLSDERQSLLDIGTGSGILAVCAAKLGYRPVEAIDIDPESIRAARANARENGVSSQIRFSSADFAGISTPKQYSVVCANLISNLLLDQKTKLLALVQKGGLLVLAGILKTEFKQVQAGYEALGFRLVHSRTEREWQSGCFVT
jgi:ribosomal protein L11 methyltransferase